MLDSSQLRSVKDIAVARKRLQQQAAEQSHAMQHDVDVLRKEINTVRHRISKISGVFSSIFSLFSPVSSVALGFSRRAWLIPIVRSLFKRFFVRHK